MRLLNYELGEWKIDKNGNITRSTKDDNCVHPRQIGLVKLCCSTEIHYAITTWDLQDIYDLLFKMFGTAIFRIEYKESELEQAKQYVDSIINKVNKLQGFL